MYLYLASALSHYKKIDRWDKVTKWRDILIDFCDDNNVKYFNPAKEFPLNICNRKLDEKLIVDQNIMFMKKSSIMIVNLDCIEYSPGTQFEMCYFSQVLKRPIIAIGEKNGSPHILYSVSQHCDNVDEVMEVLQGLFSQDM